MQKDSKRKTHRVIDKTYHEDEGQGCYAGTQEECQEFLAEQGSQFGLEIVPMTKEELKIYNE
jgi:hypothetical protein